MRWPIALALLACLTAFPAPATAQFPTHFGQTTIQELLDMHRAGMPDDVLIALFEGNETTFFLNADDLIYLRQQGLSERVLLAMLATRQRPPEPDPEPVNQADAAAQPAAPVIVQVEQRVDVERSSSRREPRVVHVPVPVVVSAPRRRSSGVGVRNTPARSAPAPRYWGFGGQRRPDSWQPRTAPAPKKTPPRTDPRSGVGRGGGGGG